MFTFLRSLFIVHDWSRPDGSAVRSCRVCGRREALDVDDGVNLAAWYPVWEGYAGAHIARRHTRDATAGGAGLADERGAPLPIGAANALARARSAGD